MSEFKLVPARMLLDKETITAINFHCGDGGDNFGEHSDGLLWVGAVTDDEGKEVYGLHLATAEYPEEGSTTLVEFDEPVSDFDAQRLRADTAEAKLAKLSELLKKFFEFVEMAPVSSGVCCCGSDTSQENHGDHMAVDQWDHSISLWGREIEVALSTASPATINQQGEA